MAEQDKQYDIFISYDDADKAWAEWIAYDLESLKPGGYTCMLRAWDIRAGQNEVYEIDKALRQAQRVMLLLSPDYLEGKKRLQEWTAAYRTADSQLLLPVIVREVKADGFLGNLKTINLVGLTEEEAKQSLLTAVENLRLKPLQRPPFPGSPDTYSAAPLFPGRSSSHNVTPHPSGKNILIVSLGESPVVVTAMYDMLTKVKHLAFEKVIVLCPSGVVKAYNLVLDTFAQPELLEYEGLKFEDLNSYDTAVRYLQCLYKILDRYEQAGDQVYLALVGGRKSMAALMAWVVPFFSCVKALYHLLEKVEGTMLVDTDEVASAYPSRRRELMHPDPDKFDLVEIPQPVERQFNPKFKQFLLTATDEEIERWSKEDQQRFYFAKEVVNPNSSPLELRFTEAVLRTYKMLMDEKSNVAQQMYNCFEQMTDPERLRQLAEGKVTFKQSASESAAGKKLSHGKERIARLHFYADTHVPLQPVFYTRPGDIDESPEENVIEEAVICALEPAQQEKRRTLKKITADASFSLFPASNAKWPLAERPTEKKNSILIVPLGTSPMIATQLYTLLTEQEHREIAEVILLYPAKNSVIIGGAKLIQRALKAEKAPVTCILTEIPHLEDVRSDKECLHYQQHLESTILLASKHWRGYTIDLALSGGRKGMAAIAMFAAQKLQLPFVYHTLIRDQQLSDKIEKETSIDELDSLRNNKKELHNRLFLRAYDESPYNKFVLFNVPVFPAAQL